MATKPKRTGPVVEPLRGKEFDNTPAVTAWLKTLEHPLKPLIELIRQGVLAADPTITEGIKWNTASFYCHGWFATVHSRAKIGVQLILHQGAKVRDSSTLSQTIKDSTQLLTWLTKDRAIIIFHDPEDFQRKQAAFKKIIKQWVKCQRDLAE